METEQAPVNDSLGPPLLPWTDTAARAQRDRKGSLPLRMSVGTPVGDRQEGTERKSSQEPPVIALADPGVEPVTVEKTSTSGLSLRARSLSASDLTARENDTNASASTTSFFRLPKVMRRRGTNVQRPAPAPTPSAAGGKVQSRARDETANGIKGDVLQLTQKHGPGYRNHHELLTRPTPTIDSSRETASGFLDCRTASTSRPSVQFVQLPTPTRLISLSQGSRSLDLERVTSINEAHATFARNAKSVESADRDKKPQQQAEPIAQDQLAQRLGPSVSRTLMDRMRSFSSIRPSSSTSASIDPAASEDTLPGEAIVVIDTPPSTVDDGPSRPEARVTLAQSSRAAPPPPAAEGSGSLLTDLTNAMMMPTETYLYGSRPPAPQIPPFNFSPLHLSNEGDRVQSDSNGTPSRNHGTRSGENRLSRTFEFITRNLSSPLKWGSSNPDKSSGEASPQTPEINRSRLGVALEDATDNRLSPGTPVGRNRSSSLLLTPTSHDTAHKSRPRASTLMSRTFHASNGQLTPPSPLGSLLRPHMMERSKTMPLLAKDAGETEANLSKVDDDALELALGSKSATASPLLSPALTMPMLTPLLEETPFEFLDRISTSLPRASVMPQLARMADPFFATSLRLFFDSYDFKDTPLDLALRRLLLDVQLPRESQQIDRAMEAFAARYHICNPRLFKSADTAYTIAFSLIMLHTDAFNKNNKHKMTRQEYVRNTAIDGVRREILECFYDNITHTPIVHQGEPTETETSKPATHEPMTTSPPLDGLGIAEPDQTVPAQQQTRRPLPTRVQSHDQLRQYRIILQDIIPSPNPYSFIGTAVSVNVRDLRESFSRANLLEIGNQRHRSADHGILHLKVGKVGLLARKEDLLADGQKSSSRRWRGWSVILTASQLLFFVDSTWALSLLAQQDDLRSQGHTGRSVLLPKINTFRPDAILNCHDGLALHDSTYDRYPNVFRFIAQNGRQYLLQAPDATEMNDWIAKINYAAAFKTAGVKMRHSHPSLRVGRPMHIVKASHVVLDVPKLSRIQKSVEPPLSSNKGSRLSLLSIPTPLGGGSSSAPPSSDVDLESPIYGIEEGEAPPSTQDIDHSSGAAQRRSSWSHHSLPFSSDARRLQKQNSPQRRLSTVTDHQASAGLKTQRAEHFQSKVAAIERTLVHLCQKLKTELRSADHLSILCPLQKSTRDRLQARVPHLAKNVQALRIDIARLLCYHSMLLADLRVGGKHQEGCGGLIGAGDLDDLAFAHTKEISVALLHRTDPSILDRASESEDAFEATLSTASDLDNIKSGPEMVPSTLVDAIEPSLLALRTDSAHADNICTGVTVLADNREQMCPLESDIATSEAHCIVRETRPRSDTVSSNAPSDLGFEPKLHRHRVVRESSKIPLKSIDSGMEPTSVVPGFEKSRHYHSLSASPERHDDRDDSMDSSSTSPPLSRRQSEEAVKM